MIRPQVPLRTPCYNLARLAEHRIDAAPKDYGSSRPYSAGLMGGVCKAQGLIHRALVTPDYWGFQLHEVGFQTSIRTEDGFRGLPCPFGFETHCPIHCMPRVAQEIRAIQIYRCPPLPQGCPCSLLRVLQRNR